MNYKRKLKMYNYSKGLMKGNDYKLNIRVLY